VLALFKPGAAPPNLMIVLQSQWLKRFLMCIQINAKYENGVLIISIPKKVRAFVLQYLKIYIMCGTRQNRWICLQFVGMQEEMQPKEISVQ